MKKSYLIAFVFVIVLSVWIFSGQSSTTTETVDLPTTIAEQRGGSTFVKVEASLAQPHKVQITLRGRTEAIRTVHLRSQTDGQVAKVLGQQGDRVKEGDLICQLDVDDRAAKLDEAKALRAQRALEYAAAQKLSDKGHRSDTQTAAAKALYDAAKAMVTQMEINLGHAEITAAFDGIIDQRPAEVGDYLRKGDVCAVLMDENPFLVVGYISEQNVAPVEIGMPADVRLVTGEQLTGTVRYISKIANPNTRTFRIEVLVNNPDAKLRDGITTEINMGLSETYAHHITPGVLVLNEAGIIGLRLADENNTVIFAPVEIIDSDDKGVWVKGLPEKARIITVGQEFVAAGQKVRLTNTAELQH
ncbi:MAG: efflux transporter periplasmic adaptor subunit [Kordiimonas sp.]|nr:efflux transporter periplasmic adaptor subunit [Kordiimonas sp.]|tara:strand:+ start:277 stop:1353 length:1077 start_codon:yes stop_codon:yes gene_type:complete